MSSNLDSILDKITNENIEINCRAMQNLLNKITNGLVSLESIDHRIGYKFLFCLSNWLTIFLSYHQQYKYDPTLLKNVLLLFNKCIDTLPPSATQKLKKDFKISSLINDIGMTVPDLVPLCDQIQHSLSQNTLNMMNNSESNRQNQNFAQTQQQQNDLNNMGENVGTYGNLNNNMAETYLPGQKSSNEMNFSSNKVQSRTEPDGFGYISNSNTNVNVNPNINNTLNNSKNFMPSLSERNVTSNQNMNPQNLINTNHFSKSENNIQFQQPQPQPQVQSQSQFIQSQNVPNIPNIQNPNPQPIIQSRSSPLVNPSLVILHENINTNSNPNNQEPEMNTLQRNTQQVIPPKSKPTRPPNENPTFPRVLVPQQEEQFIFDMGINLKYGDPLQIYQSFNILYTQILNDIPIEYLLHCEEMIKSICQITETYDFLEFGAICYKIIDKILTLIEKKISLELNNSSSIRPITLQKSQNLNIEIDQDTTKVESFLFYLLTSILIGMNNSISKLAFYLPLLERTLNLLNQTIIIYSNYYEIFYKVLQNFDKIVNNYKGKNIDISNFFIFLLKTYINLDDNFLVDLIEYLDFDVEVEVIQFIKNIFFTVFSGTNNDDNNENQSLINTLCCNLLNKFEKLKEKSEKINSFLIDYNNANLIGKSIELTQEMLRGENLDRHKIINNFYNILLSLKFLNNSPNQNNDQSEYNSIFPNNSTPLIKTICDYYIENTDTNYAKSVDLLSKLLSFKDNDKIEITLSIYKSILDEIKIKGSVVYPLFLNDKIMNIIFNDLTNDNYKEVILDIIFLLFSEMDDKTKSDMNKFFVLLPSFPNNLKFDSLQTKYETSMKSEDIYFKYLRNLFSKTESIRKHAMDFFREKNDPSTQETGVISTGGDNVYCIQTGESEMLKTLKMLNDKTNIMVSNTNEFLPLLSMLVSNKIDINMKSSALHQLTMMIKNQNYKNYYLNDILSYILKELDIKANQYDLTNLANYYYSLIKLLVIIVFIYLNEEKIQNLLKEDNKDTKTLLNNLLVIALKDDSMHHLLSAYALIFINIYAFYYRTSAKESSINNTANSNEALPVLRFFSPYYFINIVPTKLIDNIYTSGQNISAVLNFSVNKNIIDFIHYCKNPLLKEYNLEYLKDNIKNLKNIDLLGVVTTLTKFFEYNSIYYSDKNNIGESLWQIMLYFKRIIPNSPENKNIILDFLNILNLALLSDITGNLLNQYKNIFFPFIPDFLLKIFHYISIQKEFINTLSDNMENQNFIYEVLEFITNNPCFFPFNTKDDLCNKILIKFLETYHNIFIFNSQTNFYRVKVALIKFENIFFNEILKLNLGDKVYSDKINSIVFFLSKYEPITTFNSYIYLLWCLKYISLLIRVNKSVNIIQTKSFIFIKLLQSPFIEVKISSLNILKHLFSKELFEKHGTILLEIYQAIKKVKTKLLKINYFSFLIKSLEFILQEKNLDDPDGNQFSNELLTMNGQITEQSEVINLLNSILNFKNGDFDSIFSAMVLKFLNLCLNINLENEDYSKGIFFGYSFFDLINDIISKEISNLKTIIDINTNLDCDPILQAKPYGTIYFNDHGKKNKICLNSALESILNVKEGLNLLIRALNTLTQEFFIKYKNNISEIFLNLIKYGEFVSKTWTQWHTNNDLNHIKILQSYAIKFYSCLYFISTSKLIKSPDDILPINSIIYQQLNNICYDFMKFEYQQDNLDYTIKIMFSKILPYLLTLNNKCKDDNKMKNKNFGISANDKKSEELKLKNDGDTLLEVFNVIKKVYQIKFEVYGDGKKCQFKIEPDNIEVKNDLINSIGSLLLEGQNCKKIFVRSKFINTFIDYIYQLQFYLLNDNLEKKNSNSNSNSNNSNYNNNNSMINNNNNITNRSINRNLTGSMQSGLNNNNNNSLNDTRTRVLKNNLTNYVVNEFVNILKLFQNLMYKFDESEERKLLFISSSKDNKIRFLELLYSIFYDVLNHPLLFENYLKLLMNIISNSKGDLTPYLTTNLKTNKNDNLIDLILNHFTTSLNCMSSNPNFDLYIQFLKCLFQYPAIQNKLLKTKFDEYLKSILTDKLQQRKIHENKNNILLIGNLIKLFVSLCIHEPKKNDQHPKKLATKEFLELLCEFIKNIKNYYKNLNSFENVIYYIIFFFRNVSFVNYCRNIFVKNDILLKMIFDLFFDKDISIKIRFILSHLIWVLLYDNQTLKTSLAKPDFMKDIKNLNIHLQKELDMKKVLGDGGYNAGGSGSGGNEDYGYGFGFGGLMWEEKNKIKDDLGYSLGGGEEKKKEDKIEENNENKEIKELKEKKDKEYLENTCLNLRKILHILEA